MSRSCLRQNLCHLSFIFILALTTACSSATESYVDDTKEARDMLEEQRDKVLSDLEEEVSPQKIKKLIELGLWDKAQYYLNNVHENTDEYRLAATRLLIKQHRYGEAENIVRQILEQNPTNREAKLLQAKLDIQAWRLEEADQIAETLIEENPKDPEAGLVRGTVALLNRNYDLSLEWADRVQSWDSEFAGGYLLEAEGRFWAQDPTGAEAPLIRALELNPFNEDARFSYGYAIWRRVDATQLDDMAAQ